MTPRLTRSRSPGRGPARIVAWLCLLTGTAFATQVEQPTEPDSPPSIVDLSRAARARRGEQAGLGTWVSTGDGLILVVSRPAYSAPVPQPSIGGPPVDEVHDESPLGIATEAEGLSAAADPETLSDEKETLHLRVEEPLPSFSVSAGVDQTILLPDSSRLPVEVHLEGIVVGAAGYEARWSVVSAPRAAALAGDRALETSVRLDAPGQYVFRLSVSSAGYVLSSEVYVNIVLNRPAAVADPPPAAPPATPAVPPSPPTPPPTEEAAWNSRAPASDDEWVSPGLAPSADEDADPFAGEQTFAAARTIGDVSEEATDAVTGDMETLEPEPVADGAQVYHVSPDGDDTAPGTRERPFRTLRRALEELRPGDTLYLREGTYSESVRSSTGVVPSGESFDEAVTIRAYPGESVVLRPVTGPGILYFDAAVRYTIWRDLVLDGEALTTTGAVGIGLVNSADHNRFRNIEIRNTPGSGILVSGAGENVHNEFLGLDVHDVARGAPGEGHGIHIGSSGNLVDGGDWHGIDGSAGLSWAIRIDGGAAPSDENIVRNARVFGNAHGIALGGGANLVYNNILYGNGGTAVQIGFGGPGADNAFLHNTVVGNAGPPVQILGVSRTRVLNNILWSNGMDVIADAGTETLVGSNLDEDPLFADSEAPDFRLRETSPALDTGLTVPEVRFDFDGVERPQGAGVDIGAFERR